VREFNPAPVSSVSTSDAVAMTPGIYRISAICLLILVGGKIAHEIRTKPGTNPSLSENHKLRQSQPSADFSHSNILKNLRALADQPLEKVDWPRLADLIQRHTLHDPAAVEHWLDALPYGPVRTQSELHFVISRAARDLKAAEDRIAQWESADQRQTGYSAAAYEATDTQPAAAIRLALKHLPSAELDDLIPLAATRWCRSSPVEAVAWVRQIEDDSLKEKVIAMMSPFLFEKDPEAALELALHEMSPSRKQDGAIYGIFERIATSDPARATAWVQKFPEGNLRDQATEYLGTLAEPRAAE
jgi:hypothetical protein